MLSIIGAINEFQINIQKEAMETLNLRRNTLYNLKN